MRLGDLQADRLDKFLACSPGLFQTQSRLLDIRLQATTGKERELDSESSEQKPAGAEGIGKTATSPSRLSLALCWWVAPGWPVSEAIKRAGRSARVGPVVTLQLLLI